MGKNWKSNIDRGQLSVAGAVDSSIDYIREEPFSRGAIIQKSSTEESGLDRIDRNVSIKRWHKIMSTYLLSSWIKGAGPTTGFHLLESGSCFFFKSLHTSWHSVSGTQRAIGGSCLRLIMASLWNVDRGNHRAMCSYGESSRYLYSKMCCTGEWRDLWLCGEELLCCIALLSAWWNHMAVTIQPFTDRLDRRE